MCGLFHLSRDHYRIRCDVHQHGESKARLSKKFRSETGPLQRYKRTRKSLIYMQHARVQSSLTAPLLPYKTGTYGTGGGSCCRNSAVTRGWNQSALNASPLVARLTDTSTIRSRTRAGSFHFITSLPGFIPQSATMSLSCSKDIAARRSRRTCSPCRATATGSRTAGVRRFFGRVPAAGLGAASASTISVNRAANYGSRSAWSATALARFISFVRNFTAQPSSLARIAAARLR